ncbi:MAG: DUF2934 domain-containing protein [Planctomycetes bacterium]|nr:DUF2934 domain-containing protein [Planctomycetota bacterium]
MMKKTMTKPAGDVSRAPKTELPREQFTSEVKKRAYEIYLRRGSKPGSDVSDWIQAEKEIKARYNIK